MSYCEDFAKQFKAGDKVYVLRKADNYENGWDNEWVTEMDDLVGTVQIVNYCTPKGVQFNKSVCAFPPFVLEKIVTENPFKVGDNIKVWVRASGGSYEVNRVVKDVDALFVLTDAGVRHRHQFCTLVKSAKKQWKLGCQTFSWEGDKFTSGIYFAKLSTLKTIYEQATSDFPPSSWVLHGAEITLDNKCFYYGKELTVLGNIKLLREILDAYPGNPSS